MKRKKENPDARRIYKEIPKRGYVRVRLYRNRGIPCLTWRYSVKEFNSGSYDDLYISVHQMGAHRKALRKAQHYMWWRTIAAPLYKLFES